MQPSSYHPLLNRQISETFGDMQQLPTSMMDLLAEISASYQQFETEHDDMKAKIKLRTEQLIASTSQAYSFLDSLNMGFILCDVSADVMLTNQALRSILSQKISDNSTSEEPQDGTKHWTLETIEKLLQPEVQLKELVLNSLATNHPQALKETNFGKRVLHILIAPMVNKLSSGESQQIGAVVLVEDITEQKVLERSKDEFMSIASHELRTPLTAIRGNASIIRQYYGNQLPNKDTVEMIDDIHESAVRLIEIVNDFLDASSLEQGKMQMHPEAFQLREVCESVIRELQNLAEYKGVNLISQASVSSAPSINADKQRIKQVLYNLIGNAIKFTDHGGSIVISTQSNQSFVYVSVTDTGIGMSSENQSLLFRKFQQASNSLLTRDNTKGTGMGLYICKLIMEQTGGTIRLEHSEEGKGSSFVFSVPRAKDSDQPAQAYSSQPVHATTQMV